MMQCALLLGNNDAPLTWFQHGTWKMERKPLWTVCGTRGSAVVESWDGAATVTTVSDDGRQSTTQVPPVSGPGWGGYYKNVADHLLSGAPLIITAERARGTIQCIEGCEIAARENRLVEVAFDL